MVFFPVFKEVLYRRQKNVVGQFLFFENHGKSLLFKRSCIQDLVAAAGICRKRNKKVRLPQGKKLTEIEERAYATTDEHNAVPTAVADKFFEKMKKLAPMLSEITLMRVAGNLKFMAEGTRAEATTHVENTAVAPADDALVSVTLGGKEFMKVIRISASAKTMSINAF